MTAERKQNQSYQPPLFDLNAIETKEKQSQKPTGQLKAEKPEEKPWYDGKLKNPPVPGARGLPKGDWD